MPALLSPLLPQVSARVRQQLQPGTPARAPGLHQDLPLHGLYLLHLPRAHRLLSEGGEPIRTAGLVGTVPMARGEVAGKGWRFPWKNGKNTPAFFLWQKLERKTVSLLTLMSNRVCSRFTAYGKDKVTFR